MISFLKILIFLLIKPTPITAFMEKSNLVLLSFETKFSISNLAPINPNLS